MVKENAALYLLQCDLLVEVLLPATWDRPGATVTGNLGCLDYE